jgi:hypothetical protein
VAFGKDGSIHQLSVGGGRSWASSSKPLGLFTYQTLSPQDFTDFDKDYGNGGCKPESEDPGYVTRGKCARGAPPPKCRCGNASHTCRGAYARASSTVQDKVAGVQSREARLRCYHATMC